MAKTKNIKEAVSNIETENITSIEEEMVPKTQFDELAKKTAKLEEMLSAFLSEYKDSKKNVENVSPNAEYRMDKLGTLIHLVECDPQLPDNVTIGGKIHYFTTFGEKKAFRWEDLSNFISTHRILFTRGIFALGADCDIFESEIPSDIKILKLPNHFYTSMVSISNDEFSDILYSMTETQRIQVSLTWRRKYLSGAPGYRNTDKMKILNKITNGSLKDILEEVATD